VGVKKLICYMGSRKLTSLKIFRPAYDNAELEINTLEQAIDLHKEAY